VYADVLFIDDFETGNLAKWDYSHNCEVSTEETYEGNYSVKFETAYMHSAAIKTTLGFGYNRVTAHHWMKFTSYPDEGDPNSKSLLTAFISSTGRTITNLLVQNTTEGTLNFTVRIVCAFQEIKILWGEALELNEWYNITEQLNFAFTDHYQLYLNDTLTIDTTGLIDFHGYINEYMIAQNREGNYGSACIRYVDDVIIGEDYLDITGTPDTVTHHYAFNFDDATSQGWNKSDRGGKCWNYSYTPDTTTEQSHSSPRSCLFNNDIAGDPNTTWGSFIVLEGFTEIISLNISFWLRTTSSNTYNTVAISPCNGISYDSKDKYFGADQWLFTSYANSTFPSCQGWTSIRIIFGWGFEQTTHRNYVDDIDIYIIDRIIPLEEEEERTQEQIVGDWIGENTLLWLFLAGSVICIISPYMGIMSLKSGDLENGMFWFLLWFPIGLAFMIAYLYS